jgi:hypothetical protein
MPATTSRPPVQTRGARGPLLVLLILLGAAFLLSAAAFLLPSLAAPFQDTPERREVVAGPPPPLTSEERTRVLDYAGALQPDDALVQVRPGVQAKRSNVEGVRLRGRTVYYDILGHQSFGPLGRGRVREDGVDVLERSAEGPFQVVIYTLR